MDIRPQLAGGGIQRLTSESAVQSPDEQLWERVWAIYTAASALPREKRASYVRAITSDAQILDRVFRILEELESGDVSDAESDKASAKSGIDCGAPAPMTDAKRAGSTFGRFTITGVIGQGGMGRVYSAHDPELDRSVAIKCVAPGRLGTASATSSFINEARAASALNHPGIVTVFEVIRAEDEIAIVMELVQGEPLGSRGSRPQLPEHVAAWGERIAEALAACHARGIIHRDIKPENLILRPDGYIKVLDFGLAMGRSVATEALPMGTIRYMSPEQTQAGQITPATDVFSLGIVLYELIAGAHPFSSGSRQDSTVSIGVGMSIGEAPPLSRSVKTIDKNLERLIGQMLLKEPGKRPSAAEVAQRLRAMRLSGRGLRLYPIVAVAGVFVGLAAAVWALSLTMPSSAASRSPQPAVLRAYPFTSYQGAASEPSFSPDGSRIAFVWTGAEGSNLDIYWKAIGEESPHRLTNDTAEDFNPVYSPDGKWIAFFRRPTDVTAPQVIVIPAEGGPERVMGTVARTSNYRGIAWWPDGKSLIVRDIVTLSGALVRLFPDGHKVPFSTPPDSQADGLPSISPDGTRIAFIRYHTDGAEACWTDLSGSPVHCPARASGLNSVAWDETSQALYFADGTALWRVADGGGEPLKVADGVYSDLAADRGGKHFAFDRPVSDSNVWRVGRDGKKPSRVVASSGEDSDPAWSPDGSRFVVRSNRSGAYELYSYKADGSDEHQITHFGAHLSSPRWSPDGKWIAFDGNRAPVDRAIRHHNIYLVPSSGGAFRRLTDDGLNYVVPGWSRDGKWVYFYQISQPPVTRRVSVNGGPSEYVGDAMYDATESVDGRYFYYTIYFGSPGIWRRPVRGGRPELMRGTGGVHLFRYWDLTDKGIYYVDGPPNAKLRYLDLASGRASTMGTLPPSMMTGQMRGLAASPDGSSVLYSIQDVVLGDILLVDRKLVDRKVVDRK